MIAKEAHSSISERLRDAREAAGLSQGQIAKKLGMHRPTVSEIEAGRRKVSAEEVATFAAAYGVSTNWILSGSDGENPEDAKLLIAARELSRMSSADLDRLTSMLRMLRKSE